MASSKRVLFPYVLMDNVSVATEQVSTEIDSQSLDNNFINVVWGTGSSVGKLYVEVLTDRNNTWTKLDYNTDININMSSAGSHQLTFTSLPFSKLRLKYTPTSGSGNLTASIQGKGV